jgi:hypothetical protein
MTGVFQRWFSSTLHVGWGLCDRVCLVLVCRGGYCLGAGGSSLHAGIEFGRSRTRGVFGGEKKGGGVRSRPGSARTILLFQIVGAKPSEQARMVGSTLGVYSFALIFVSARTNERHHHHHHHHHHWTERVWYCHNQRWLQSSREGTEASKSGSFKDEQEWGKKCFKDLDQRRMGNRC